MSNVKIARDAVVCDDNEITGDVTIGRGTIIHPKVKISANAGPIIIGENNLIEEKVIICNKAGQSGSTPVMIIGNCNVFEVGSVCEALKVGDSNLLEANSYIGREVVISDGCIVGSGCALKEAEVLPKQSVVYGSKCMRRNTPIHQNQSQQMETLAKLLPTYLNVGKMK